VNDQGPAPVADNELLLNPMRVLLLCVVSTGLYLLFWSYFTWRQLQPVTGDRHFPVWHALTLFVPIYSIFRLHRHFSIINDEAVKAGTSSIGPGAAVTLVVLANVLAFASVGITDVAAGLVVTVISTGLITTALYFAQDALNQVWRARNRAAEERRSAHGAEIVVTAFGALGWLGTFAG
jgi:hypothetical protein